MHVDIVPYALPFRRPFVTGAAEHAVRRGWLVRVAGDDALGTAGWGEAAPLPGHGGEDLAAVPAALHAFAAAVSDPDAAHLIDGTPPGWAPLHALSTRLFPRAYAFPCARAAFDLALADLLARRTGLPLARWLSRAARTHVAVNAVIDASSPVDPSPDDPSPDVAERAAAAVAAGFRTLKVKLTADRDADERRLHAIREAVGPHIALRGDANGVWEVEEAIDRLRALAAFDLRYVEQPVAAADVAGLARVRRHADVPIAADEALLYPHGPGIDAVLAAEAADVVVLKPSLLGGPSAAWAAAAWAAAHGVAVTVTTSLDSAVGRHGALAVAAALYPPPGACGLATGGLLESDVGPDIVIHGGEAIVAAADAGAGFTPTLPADRRAMTTDPGSGPDNAAA